MVAGFSDVLAHWMDAVGIARAAFMGNSFGCQIVADLAVRHSTRVTRAVLIGPTVDPAHHTLLQQGARLLLDGAREPGRYLALLLGDCIKIGPREGAQLVRVVLADRIEDNLPQVRVPILVVRGARSPGSAAMGGGGDAPAPRGTTRGRPWRRARRPRRCP